MKILVTSGGTKVPIDRVRDITNMSTGTFGSKIAAELLKLQQEVYFFKAKGSKTPFKVEIDLAKGYNDSNIEAWTKAHLDAIEKMKDTVALLKRYKEMEYRTFEEYKERLERVIKIEQPDVVVLAAAVSDYGVANFVEGKMRSNNDYKIVLEQLPKLIYFIKEWMPTTKLVGFKLLVGSKDYQLIDAAKRSIADNKCHMIVANDLADIKDSKHKVHLVYPSGEPITYQTDPMDSNFLARKVAEHIVKL